MQNSASLRFVVFDFDGTLVDSAAGIVAGVEACWAACGFPAPDPEAVRRTIGLPTEESILALLPDAGEKEFARIRAYHAEIADGTRARPPAGTELFPGAAETLRHLEGADCLLAIVTSRGSSRVGEILAGHGIDRHFLTVKTVDHGPGKPNPYLLFEAMREAGASPDATVMIGDTVFDVQMALNAGTRAMGVSWGVHGVDELKQAGAHRVVDAFDEVPSTVGHLIGE